MVGSALVLCVSMFGRKWWPSFDFAQVWERCGFLRLCLLNCGSRAVGLGAADSFQTVLPTSTHKRHYRNGMQLWQFDGTPAYELFHCGPIVEQTCSPLVARSYHKCLLQYLKLTGVASIQQLLMAGHGTPGHCVSKTSKDPLSQKQS